MFQINRFEEISGVNRLAFYSVANITRQYTSVEEIDPVYTELKTQKWDKRGHENSMR